MTKEEQFEIFWASYPNKKAKADALKAFKAAIKVASLEKILEGITRYVANKPEWQAYKYPASWLRAGSWDDEWEPQQPKAPRSPFASPGRFTSREEYLAAEMKRSERSFR